jgi:hypothetical protein
MIRAGVAFIKNVRAADVRRAAEAIAIRKIWRMKALFGRTASAAVQRFVPFNPFASGCLS